MVPWCPPLLFLKMSVPPSGTRLSRRYVSCCVAKVQVSEIEWAFFPILLLAPGPQCSPVPVPGTQTLFWSPSVHSLVSLLPLAPRGIRLTALSQFVSLPQALLLTSRPGSHPALRKASATSLLLPSLTSPSRTSVLPPVLPATFSSDPPSDQVLTALGHSRWLPESLLSLGL